MHLYKKLKVYISNFLLVITDYTYIKPRRFIGDIFSKKNLSIIINQLHDATQSDGLKALSAAVGIFIGIIPIWGFQTLAAIFLAVTLRLNKALVIIFSQISFPPMIPLIIYLSYRIGKYWMGKGLVKVSFGINVPFLNKNQSIEQYIYGSITLAILAAIGVGMLTYGALKVVKVRKQFKPAPTVK